MWENPPLPPAQRAQAEREDSVRRAAPFVPPPPQAQPWTLERASSGLAAYLPETQALVGLAVLLGVAMALFALWYQMTPAPRIVEFPKLKEERHIWIGTPRQGLFIQPQHVFSFLFGLVWSSILYSILKPALENAIRGDAFYWIFVLFGVPFVLVGVYMLVGQPFADARRRRITTYALTNQRVLLSVGKKLNSRALDRLEEPTLIEHRDGTGTITLEAKVDAADFERVTKLMQEKSPLKTVLAAKRGSLSDIAAFSPRTDKHGRRMGASARFERIPDARRVYRLMLEAMAPAKGGDLPEAPAPTRTITS